MNRDRSFTDLVCTLTAMFMITQVHSLSQLIELAFKLIRG